MIADAERQIQRDLTTRFIEADPVEIQLVRPIWSDDGSGGRVRSADTNVGGLQRMRLIPLSDGTTERYTLDGKQVFPQYMLLGTYDADMQRWDEFTLDSHRYQVVFINQNRQYEVKGEVAYLA